MKDTRKLFSSIGFNTFAVFECRNGEQRLWWFCQHGELYGPRMIGFVALRHYIPKIERFLVKGGYDVSLLDPYKAVLPEWENKAKQP